MSALMVGIVFNLENLDPQDKLVLLAFAECADDDNATYTPMPTIAEKTGYDWFTSETIIGKLEAEGWLIRDGCGKKQRQFWRVNTDRL